MRTIRAPESKQTTTLLVAVKCRPLTAREQSKCREILKVADEKVVVVSDPESSKDYLDRVQNRRKDKIYAFDFAFGPQLTNRDVYKTTILPMIGGVIQGLNATIFAYGATGSGKTYTMAGTPEDPGLMVLSLRTIFDLISKEESSLDFDVTCSYLEVYNEVIYDLLDKSSGHLELREDPDQGITVAGLRRIKVNSADKIFELLNVGNSRRKTESTEANATSSRSHAVLEITVKRQQKNQYRSQVLRGKLALVDLAGSERASETNNAGQKLRDGANINRSLLALATCINALGKQQKKGLAYVPYRNSKLTRILKDGLSGNSRTIMIATVSPADDQYHHTINTLKYADRAKEIKTHIQKNIGTVDSHVADYQRMIDNLQVEVCQLRKELAEKESQLSIRPAEKTVDDELSWLDELSRDTNENIEERINLQKALFELEDINLRNRIELQHLDDIIAKQQAIEKEGRIVQALGARRQVILDNIRDNDEAGANYHKEIEINEAHRSKLQKLIDEAIDNNGNKTYLRILRQYRLLGMTNTELQFQIAVRDQIIHNQRETQSNLWTLLGSSGLNHKQIQELATKQGITIEDWIIPPGSPVLRKISPAPISGRYPQCLPPPQSLTHSTSFEKTYVTSPRNWNCDLLKLQSSNNHRSSQIHSGLLRGADPRSVEYGSPDVRGMNQSDGPLSRNSKVPPTEAAKGICTMRQEHHSSFEMVSHLHTPSALLARRAGNHMGQRSQQCSAETCYQDCCSHDTVCVDPMHDNSKTQGLNCGWNEGYGGLAYYTPGETQPFTADAQLRRELWNVNHQMQNLHVTGDGREVFANHVANDSSNVNAIHEAKVGRVLFPQSSDRVGTHFIPNDSPSRISPMLNSHHIIYNSQSTYYQNYPVFSSLQSPSSEHKTREGSNIDSTCGVSQMWSDHRFKYSSNRPCQLWPEQSDGWKQ
ncbi:hypothetical protein SUGI_0610950 [Cryptomeria japonica]|nr:hypothetical protein SUGI_0610950 [Cryptomeria japonica]